MKIYSPRQVAGIALIAILALWATHPAFSQKIYKVGVPVCDTISTTFISHGALGGCDPYDYLLFRLAPSLIPYVTGLSIEMVIIETNGRIWSSLSDTVKSGDMFSLMQVATDSGFKIFLATSSSFKFITRIVGTPMVSSENYYCAITQAQTTKICENAYVYFGEGPICQVQPATSVEEKDSASIPAQFQLLQNYPNPFNPQTTIEYTLPQSSFVKLKVFDMLGQEVRTLMNAFQQSGVKSVVWDGRDNQGQLVPSGQYFYRLVADEFTQTAKSLLLK